MSSASEVEVGGLFHNTKSGEPIRVTLEEMSHPKQATPMQENTSTAEGIENNTIQKKVPKQCIFGSIGYNIKSTRVIATCFGKQEQPIWLTIKKNYPPYHHCRMRPVYLNCQGNSNNASARVCNYNQNTSLKEIPKQDSNKKTHLKIRKLETHIQADW